jgi:dienelactone hydrolase
LSAVLGPATRLLGLLGLAVLCTDAAIAAERVRFESARYQLGPLQRRHALEHRDPIFPRPVDVIDGYLTRPDGPGPFPAIVHLHGCGGLPNAVKANAGDHFWAKRLAAWGYAVLVVDSFTARNISNTCSGEWAPRVADAYGALAWLARQPFVDADRIGIIGFSAGGIATLSIVETRDFELFESEAAHRFVAAVAYYPICFLNGDVKMPTLVLIGERDDWTPAAACKSMMTRRKPDGPVKVIIYPGAHHSFDVPRPQGQRYFGHWLEYNADAAEAASQEVRQFLAERLAK